jgi:hypothetical protein
MLAPYKTCRAPPSLVPYNPLWHAQVHVYRKGAKEPWAQLSMYDAIKPSAPAWVKYGIYFPRGLFVKKVF